MGLKGLRFSVGGNHGMTPAVRLSADGNVAEAEHDTAAGGKASKTHLRAKARKQEHQIELAANRVGIRSGKNSVTYGFTLRVDCSFHEQSVRAGMAGLLEASNREWSEGFQARRLEQVCRRIVGSRAQRLAQSEKLADHDEDHEGDRETARRRN